MPIQLIPTPFDEFFLLFPVLPQQPLVEERAVLQALLVELPVGFITTVPHRRQDFDWLALPLSPRPLSADLQADDTLFSPSELAHEALEMALLLLLLEAVYSLRAGRGYALSAF